MNLKLSLAALVAGLAASTVATALPLNPADAAARCHAIEAPGNTQLVEPGQWQTGGALPPHCQLRGQINKRTRFELRLPQDWNGRFVMAGCGGFCGSLLPDKPGYSNSINAALKKGYAAISHDGGHQGQSWETQWAYSDPEALELYAHKVLPVVSDVGLSLTTAFYGEAPHHRYFSGCSNGGRLGMMAAQRYPELFDGIAAGGAIFSLSEVAGKWGNWMTRQTMHQGKPALSRQKNALLKQSVIEQCDQLDGQLDGIISAPKRCRPDFSGLQCQSNTTGKDCFSQDEVMRLQRLYSGKRDDGTRVTETLEPGAEHYTDIWLFGEDNKPAWGLSASAGYRNLLSQELFQREHSAPLDAQTLQQWVSTSRLPALLDADNPDLSGLRNAGGKLFIYHGWADPLIIPQPMLDYYQRAAAHSGGVTKLADHARLFMVPGWGHCWERPADAPDQFDPLEIVANWVENGAAPDHFIASQLDSNGEILRQRPVCAYPQQARLVDKDQPEKVASYQCQ
ncbi:tannase/feruloyl esterase family alpha/beta hydrolase [Spongiibacter tropicus]|uniref:tannase/feruloyl esterase family alpha/beta hydrolase n=1 Tax=Spongiibacter tropicus TaxID=454602 RepID=UPI0003B6949F|nr:tannase/feruloyl esterase family alpha/beta hydrolase [Spongiibacter tropicus]